MKRSELKCGKPLKRTGGPKRSQPRRDWREARAKVEREGRCRLSGEACPTTKGCDCETCIYECFGRLEVAHIIGREHDKEPVAGDHTGDITGTLWVYPERIIPLCVNHHRRYDAHELDVLHVLTLDEQLQAVRDAGSVELMRRRTAPSAYRREAA